MKALKHGQDMQYKESQYLERKVGQAEGSEPIKRRTRSPGQTGPRLGGGVC